jgi:hypothetical protein
MRSWHLWGLLTLICKDHEFTTFNDFCSCCFIIIVTVVLISSVICHRDVQASSVLLDDKFEVRLGSLSDVCPQEGEGHQNSFKKLWRFSA